MKSLIIAAAMLGASLSAQAQTNVSIQVGQPGFYGRIDLGDFRQPPVVYAQPIIIERHARIAPEPLYLRVPPGHMKKWSKHCSRYNACGRQVYFVRDDWYTNTYAPRYRETRYGGDRGGRDYRVEQRPVRVEQRPVYVERDDRRDRHEYRGPERDERGPGKGHGNGNGNGHGNGNGNGHGKH